ncbi:MAG: type III pantothenate kinase [Thiobacillus sp.]
MSTRLLIDAGNTRLKWVRMGEQDWQAQGWIDYSDWSAFVVALAGVSRCFVACVAGAAHRQRLAEVLAEAGVDVIWLRSEAAYGDLVNGYAVPEQLGVDRWMALIAARARTSEPLLVVSAGTAMTVDAISAAGRFLGGIIVPGVQLMREALRQGTAGVEPAEGHVEAFPRGTSDAVHSGIVAALCGAVRRQFEALAAHAGQVPRCIVTGGDAAVIAPHLDWPVEIVPALVLEGIERMANQEGAS